MINKYRLILFAHCVTFSAMLVGTAVQAQRFDPDEQLRTFAACVGRLSAVAEHEWNVAGAVSQETQAQRDAVVEIVAAILPQDRSRDVLHWRNAAKQAQAALLTRASSAKDSTEMAWASQQAERLEHACTALLTL